MNLTEIDQQILALETAASNLGFAKPDADLRVRWFGESPELSLRVYLRPHDGQYHKRWDVKVDLKNPQAAFDNLLEQLNETENPLQLKQEQFTKDLARLVEDGKELDTPILADLQATMLRLSENILT